jgi:methyl-accepting chemotaxis protein
MAISKPPGGLAMEFQPMSFEEMQRAMQFLLDNAAKVDARLERLADKTDRIADGLIDLTGIVGHLARQIEETDKRLGERITQQAEQHSEQMTQLGEHIKAVDASLGIVIEMFERHLREDHGPQRPS